MKFHAERPGKFIKPTKKKIALSAYTRFENISAETQLQIKCPSKVNKA